MGKHDGRTGRGKKFRRVGVAVGVLGAAGAIALGTGVINDGAGSGSPVKAHAALATAPVHTAHKPHAGPSPYAQSARAAGRDMDRLIAHFRSDHGLLSGSGAPHAYVWEQAQATAAAIALTKVPATSARGHWRLNTLMQAFPEYWDPSWSPPAYDSYALDSNPTPWLYYDDNGWVGLDMIDAYATTGNHTYLRQAQYVYDFMAGGWDNGGPGPHGGIYFGVKSFMRDRNAITNSLAIQLATRLYQATGQHGYLQFAEKAYRWMDQTLRRHDGLYADHIDSSGVVDWDVVSYNQGMMIGANVLLYNATHQTRYLDRAEAIAKASYKTFHAGNTLHQQRAIYDAIFLRNLEMLNQLRPNPKYLQMMQTYQRYVQHHTDGSGSFHGGYIPLLDQAAAVQVNATLAQADKGAGLGR